MTDTMTRPTNEGSCACGCGDPANAKADTKTGACNCGCGSAEAAATPRTVAEEVAHLTSLRQSIDRRLSELKS